MGETRRIRFAAGESSASVQGAVVGGDRDQYLLEARAGQWMTVDIAAVEANAVFAIHEPGGGRSLPGSGETDDANRWSGELPTSGDYTVSVGGTRGNATYTLYVSIV